MKLIGREKEIKELENLYKSDSSEFVAVYGRRRVGKTFLIKKYEETLRFRTQTLIENISPKKTVHLTFIATYGLKPNQYSGMVQSVVTLDDLFL